MLRFPVQAAQEWVPTVPNVSGTPQWLHSSVGPIYSVLHEGDAAPGDTAVLIVPPFGWDEVASHRARRHWAVAFARAGLPTLRIDLPGTAESAGSARTPNLLDAWVRAIQEAGVWLLAATGRPRLAVIGLGLGGLAAALALADGGPIDDLVLWGVRARGRAMLRELVAQSGLVASEFPEDREGPAPPAGIELTGYLLAEETAAALSAVDLRQITIPAPERRRVLLLGRDELGVDEGLMAALTEAGAAVRCESAQDYAQLMAHPQAVNARPPAATIALTRDWIAAAGPSAQRPSPPVAPGRAAVSGLAATHPTAAVSETAELAWGEEPVQETILRLCLAGAEATAVLSEPVRVKRRAPVVVFLNSGSIRKTGPHRMWVELARRWAVQGVPAVRADFGPVGDAPGVADDGGDERPELAPEALISAGMLASTRDLLAALRARGIGDRFVLVGHCSGGYLAFRAALEEDGIAGVCAIDLRAFHFLDGLAQERMYARIRAVARGGVIRRLRSKGFSAREARQVIEAVAYRYRRGARASAERLQSLEGLHALDRLRDRGISVLMLFSRGDVLHPEVFGPAYQVEVARGRWPNAAIEELPTRDHMARAIWLQELTEARLERSLHDILDRLCSPPTPIPSP
jgi:pimeloyl-ACP methyl ester carboxylesterase